MARIHMHARPTAARAFEGDLASLETDVERRLREQARAAGVRQGEREAQAGSARALNEAADQLAEERERLVEELPRTAVSIALAIAREILRAEVDAGRYDIENIVRDTLRHASSNHTPCVVHLHPEDAARLEGARFRAGVSIEPDEAVGRCCANVVTPQGLLVRDLRDALDGVAAKLREHVG